MYINYNQYICLISWLNMEGFKELKNLHDILKNLWIYNIREEIQWQSVIKTKQCIF